MSVDFNAHICICSNEILLEVKRIHLIITVIHL